MKVLIDTCVIVDILQKREPFYPAAMKILLAVSNKKCTGILTAKSITDIYYILRRSIHNENEVRRLLHILFSLFNVADTFSTDCELALSSMMKDYEDAIMEALTKPGLFQTWLSPRITSKFPATHLFLILFLFILGHLLFHFL